MRGTWRSARLRSFWKRPDWPEYRRLYSPHKLRFGRFTYSYSDDASSGTFSRSRIAHAVTFAGAVISAVSIVYVASFFTEQPGGVPDHHPLNERTFSPFSLSWKERVTSTSSIFGLLPKGSASNSDQYEQAWKQGVWSVKVKQPQIQIERAYTPLPPTFTKDYDPNENRGNNLRFLIRHERGEVSTYLDRLPLYTQVDLRGPSIEYRVPENIDEVLFLAGGTGIAPAFQVAHTLFRVRPRRDQKLPKLHILWANRKREDCAGSVGDFPERSTSTLGFGNKNFSDVVESISANPLVQELNALKGKFPDNISISYFVDEEHTAIDDAVLKRYLNGAVPKQHLNTIQRNTVSKRMGKQQKKVIIISGPDGFVDYLAGPKRSLLGSEVGRVLGGRLAALNLQGWEVCKL